MSDFDGILVIPSTGVSGSSGGGGQSGPVTGSDNFFVNQLLDARGRIANSTGNLILSGTTTLSGNLNCLGTINAPISASAPTGSQDYQIGNSLDVRGYLTNSLGPLLVSGSAIVQKNLTVGGVLSFDSSSLASSSAFISYAAANSAFTASVSAFTSSTATQLGSISSFTASISSYTSSVNTFSASVNTFTGSTAAQLAGLSSFNSAVSSFTSSAAAQLSALSTFSASVSSFTASTNQNLQGLSAFTASQTTYNAAMSAFTSSAGTQLASLAGFTASADLRYVLTSSYGPYTASVNAFSASVNAFTASQATFNAAHNTFSASVNTYTASLQAINDARYVLTASFTNAQVVSMVTGTLDPRYSGSGGGGGTVISGGYGPNMMGVLGTAVATAWKGTAQTTTFTLPATISGSTVTGAVFTSIVAKLLSGSPGTAASFSMALSTFGSVFGSRTLPPGASGRNVGVFGCDYTSLGSSNFSTMDPVTYKTLTFTSAGTWAGTASFAFDVLGYFF